MNVSVSSARRPRFHRILSAGCSALLVAAGLIASGSAAAAAEIIVTNGADLADAFECDGLDSCTVTAGTDLIATPGPVIAEGRTVSFDLAGHEVSITGERGSAGIGVPPGATLVIEDSVGSAVLNTTGGDFGAGIGGGENQSAGSITINGGEVNANAGGLAAGIGGGRYGGGGEVVIGSGAEVTASGQSATAIALGSGPDFTGDGGFGSLDNAGTLTIPDRTYFTIPEGVTAANSGMLTGAGTIRNDGAIANTGTVDLTALTVTGNHYTIAFDANGGTESPEGFPVFATTMAAGAKALPTEEPTRPAHGFTGWYLSSSGSGQPVTEQTELSSLSSTVTLYAGWQELPDSQITVVSGTNPAMDTDAVTYTAAVDPVPDGGTVAFLDRETVIAECAEVPVDAAGTATCTHSTADAGRYVITAEFTGTDTAAASSSERLLQAVYSTRAGDVVAWGANGRDAGYDVPAPNPAGQIDVPAELGDVISVAAGSDHSLALTATGTIVGWGDNRASEIDVPAGLSDVVAIAAGSQYSMALRTDGTVAVWGRDDFGQTEVPQGLSDVVAIAAGDFHAVALKSDGSVVVWGHDDYGQPAVPDDLFATQISAGTFHSYALTPGGAAVGWGDFESGQLSPPGGLGAMTQIEAGGAWSLALTGGSVVAWGKGDHGETNAPDLSDAVEIGAGWYHGVARLTGGTVVVWGDDSTGQLGVPDDLDRVYALSAGGAHTLALVSTPPVITIGTTTSLTSSANPSTVGEDVTFTADVVPNPGGGTVTFSEGSSTLCSDVPVDAETGEATCAYAFTGNGSHSITAEFSGAGQYLASTSDPLTQQVGPEVTEPTITTTALPDGTVGNAYSATLAVTGGEAPYSWSYAGELPDGLQLSGNTISGVPTASGTSTFTVSVTDAGAQQDSQELTITIAAAVGVSADDSTVTAAPSSRPADGVSVATVTVTAVDTSGQPMVGATVALTAGAGSSTIAPATATTGSDGVATFSVTDTVAEQVTYTATVDGVTLTQTAAVTFTAGLTSPATSTVTASPTSVVADGETPSTITVTVLDANENPIPGEPVTLLAGPDSSVVSDPSGLSDADGVVTFTVTNTVAEQVTYTAIAGDTPLNDNATVTFTPGPTSATASTVTASPAVVLADGANASTLTVTVLDANENPIPDVPVSLAAAGGNSDISAPSGPSDDAGQVTFTVTDTVVEDVVYSASAGEIEIAQTASVSFVRGPISATASTVTASPDLVEADGETTSTITVTVLDASENPIAGEPVALFPGGDTSSVVSDPSGLSDDAGVVTFTVTNTVAQQVTYTAMAGDTPLAQTATVTFAPTAISATESTVTVSPTSVVADGETTSTITVTVVNGRDNPFPGMAVELAASGGSSVISSPDHGVTDADGVVRFTVTNTVAEQVTYTATAGEGVELEQTATVTFTAGPVSATESTVTAAPLSVVADGMSASTITVTVLDANQHPVAGQEVALTAAGGSSEVSEPSGLSDADGVVTFTVTDTVAEQLTYTATAGEVEITQTATVTFTAGPVSADVSTVTATPTTVTADGTSTSTITVTVLDAQENPVVGEEVTLTPGGGSSEVSGPSGLSDAAGEVTFTVTNTVAEAVDYRASVGEVEIAETATVTFTAGPVSADTSTVSASPLSVVADGESTSTITVTVLDAHQNPVAGQEVALAAASGSSQMPEPSGVADDAGQVAFTVTNTVAEQVTYSATAGEVEIVQTATVTFTPGAVSASESTVTAEPSTVVADGMSASTITAVLLDAQGNPVPGQTVTLIADGGSSTISPAEATSDATGTVSFAVTDTVAEEVTYSAQVSSAVANARILLLADADLTLDATATVTFIAGEVSAAESTLTAEPTTVLADGQSTSTITATLLDAHGNAVGGEEVSLVPGSGSSQIAEATGSSADDGAVTFTVTDDVAEQVTYWAQVGELELDAAVTVTFVAEPTAPLNPQATAGDAQVELSWEPPADDGQSPVLGYHVYRSTEAGERGTLLTTEGPVEVTSYTDSAVENRTTYFYAITAVNAIGEGSAAEPVEVIPFAPLTITTEQLPEGQEGVAYSAELAAAGGPVAEYSWSLVAGDLPPGLELSADGAITGTPTSAGEYAFTIGVNNPAQADLVIVIAPADAPPPADDDEPPGEPDQPSEAEVPEATADLPATGSSPAVPLGLAVLSVLAGLVVLVAARTRGRQRRLQV